MHSEEVDTEIPARLVDRQTMASEICSSLDSVFEGEILAGSLLSSFFFGDDGCGFLGS